MYGLRWVRYWLYFETINVTKLDWLYGLTWFFWQHLQQLSDRRSVELLSCRHRAALHENNRSLLKGPMASTYGETWALTVLMTWKKWWTDVLGSGISPHKHGKVTSMTFPNIESPSRGQQLKSSVFSWFEIGCFVLIVSNNPQTYLNHSQPIDLKLLFWRRHAHLKALQMWIKNTRCRKLLFEELSIFYHSLWTFWMKKFDKIWLLSLTLQKRRRTHETSSTGPAFATCFDFLRKFFVGEMWQTRSMEDKDVVSCGLLLPARRLVLQKLWCTWQIEREAFSKRTLPDCLGSFFDIAFKCPMQH